MPLLRRFPGVRHRGLFFGLRHLHHPVLVLVVVVIAVLLGVLIQRRRR